LSLSQIIAIIVRGILFKGVFFKLTVKSGGGLIPWVVLNTIYLILSVGKYVGLNREIKVIL
jgi:hypothetical protein